jgi:hypothetical protein
MTCTNQLHQHHCFLIAALLGWIGNPNTMQHDVLVALGTYSTGSKKRVKDVMTDHAFCDCNSSSSNYLLFMYSTTENDSLVMLKYIKIDFPSNCVTFRFL